MVTIYHHFTLNSAISLQMLFNILIFPLLQENNIQTIDCENLENLCILILNKNHLSSVCGIDGCINLQNLELSYNRITRIGKKINEKLFPFLLQYLCCLYSELYVPWIQGQLAAKPKENEEMDLEQTCILKLLTYSTSHLFVVWLSYCCVFHLPGPITIISQMTKNLSRRAPNVTCTNSAGICE